jgi:hypothetical protein
MLKILIIFRRELKIRILLADPFNFDVRIKSILRANIKIRLDIFTGMGRLFYSQKKKSLKAHYYIDGVPTMRARPVAGCFHVFIIFIRHFTGKEVFFKF